MLCTVAPSTLTSDICEPHDSLVVATYHDTTLDTGCTPQLSHHTHVIRSTTLSSCNTLVAVSRFDVTAAVGTCCVAVTEYNVFDFFLLLARSNWMMARREYSSVFR
uniref:Sperm-associated antigen 16 protein n=1 Tax=Lygus hesperus TaxID=30085 RepID=A0A0A9W129_LYGHE